MGINVVLVVLHNIYLSFVLNILKPFLLLHLLLLLLRLLLKQTNLSLVIGGLEVTLGIIGILLRDVVYCARHILHIILQVNQLLPEVIVLHQFLPIVSRQFDQLTLKRLSLLMHYPDLIFHNIHFI